MFSQGTEILYECRLDYRQCNKVTLKPHGEDCQSCRDLLRDDKAGWGGRLDLVAQRKEGGTIISVAPGRLYTWPDRPWCPDKSEGWCSDLLPPFPRVLLHFLLLQTILFSTLSSVKTKNIASRYWHEKKKKKKKNTIKFNHSDSRLLYYCYSGCSATLLHLSPPPRPPSPSPATAQRLVRRLMSAPV